MEKAIKLCSLINGHHQDLFPAQIKLKVMDGAAGAGRARVSLVLSDGPCQGPGSLGSRGPAQAGRAASPKPLGGRESLWIWGGGADK